MITPNDLNKFNKIFEQMKNIFNTKDPIGPLYSDGRGLTQRIFYRGTPEDYSITNNVASIFRAPFSLSGYTNEYKYTNEYMRRFTTKFNLMNNNFSRLSYMQHYGLPTRLLDVTTNLLVALYFACQPATDKTTDESGLITIFISNIESGTADAYSYYNSRSDTVEILSTLALMPEDKKSTVFSKIKCFKNKIKELDKKNKKSNINYSYTNWYQSYTGKINAFEYNFNIKLPDYIEAYFKAYHDINTFYEIQCLYHDIRKDSGHFSNTIDFENLIHPFFVEPAIDNPRIKAQSGFFLFEPYDGSSLSDKEIGKKINNSIVLKDKKEKEPLTITIPKNDKNSILKVLDQLYDINQATLFPDESNVAEYIKKNF